MTDEFPRAESADVALLLEGTFPYVSGGVSSWVNQMIRAFPDIRFALVFIGSRREDYGKPAYALPDNVVHVECHYLYDFPAPPLVQASGGDTQAFERSRRLHDALRNPASHGETAELIRASIADLRDDGPLAEEQFLYSHRAWEMMTDSYRRYCTDPSFTDYFWTVRIMHKPLWMLVRIAENLIPVKVFHTISTGYAGFLGALLRYRWGRPLLVSEHGIYTKERKIDLFQSQWIRDNRSIFEKDISQISYFRDLWVRFFETIGRVCYDAAEDIISLYEGNRLRQVIDGAPAQKTRNIPNGINLPRLAALRDKRAATVPRVMCLIGRVVPIKDVKTFIRAMLTITREMPDAEGWIAGPEDEDPDYAQECHSLAESLGLGERIKFLGFQKIDDVLPKVGVLVLSSISEALPLVVLEGFAAGVPSVTTDVGSCRQLLFGLDGEDAALGVAGAVVRIADPAALAAEVLNLLRDESRWYAAQAAGIARVERYYTQEMMVGSYRELYERLRAQPDMPTEHGARAAAAACPHRQGAR
ncbi:GT4 family glycosyltransferase PelF [Ralstonia solanacearum]|uniref:GT4 family glycosyltransferase PelF n=1 Tax=Ralstonia solanacearum TaxID=305 RepID=UPI0005AC9D71|nr:GT4 family glycosyltransferase PelF [Ralstonia solanacearum]AST32751.2 GT4 family glycosyltransferase PelF [Ralstonia solanacearum]ATJ85839.1 glycosyl transferase family 1 [Ralstonia solanacearum]AYB51026.1 GT4 family glycosyltransferase PelF [Ralstonia solanacearum]AYB55578.1 GT4 family glycosyltransferase PelF [Ralstonia solanacearum]MBB6590711.1 GT4 family glycosyltransferase PelF [Ralstonia solanacearum]